MLKPRIKLFQSLVIAIFFTFMGVMVVVLYTTHTRRTGATGLTMGRIQEMRLNAKKMELQVKQTQPLKEAGDSTR